MRTCASSDAGKESENARACMRGGVISVREVWKGRESRGNSYPFLIMCHNNRALIIVNG
jgi:hypothetical protein